MALEITGKLSQILPLETGEGKNGPWKKQFFILEFMDGNYPKKVSVSVWGDKTDSLRNLQPGANVKVSFNVESREYNGRWYTEARAWKVDKVGGGSSVPPPDQEPFYSESASSEDLPF